MTLVYEVVTDLHPNVVCPTMEDALDAIESLDKMPSKATIRVWRGDVYWELDYTAVRVELDVLG